MNGTAIGIQMIHYGRQCPPGSKVRFPLIAPSAIPWSPSEEVPSELTKGEIRRIQQEFVDAAQRAKKAGFDPLPTYREPDQSPLGDPQLFEKYPMILTTGARDLYYTHSQHRNIQGLKEKESRTLCGDSS
jgi:anaerobic selenocysteine-containing dehydrogenase